MAVEFGESETGRSHALSQWELGVGPSFLRLHQYRGSDQFTNYNLILPYFIYRGEKLYAKNSSIVGNLYQQGPWRLNLSLMGSLPVSGHKNRARQGMPRLRPTTEVGPVLTYKLTQWSGEQRYLSLNLALRQVFAVDFLEIDAIGQFATPYLLQANLPKSNSAYLYYDFSLALMAASAPYHRYFYDVAPTYARSDRPAYRAHSGYSGAHATSFISRQFDGFYSYLFLRYDRLSGASFEHSPLVKKRDYMVVIAGFIWYFYQSDKKVSRPFY